MSAYQAQFRTTQTLTPSVVDTVTLTANPRQVEILNVNGTNALFVTTGSGSVGVPTVGGTECYVIPAIAGAALVVDCAQDGNGNTLIQLISSGATQYSVGVV